MESCYMSSPSHSRCSSLTDSGVWRSSPQPTWRIRTRKSRLACAVAALTTSTALLGAVLGIFEQTAIHDAVALAGGPSSQPVKDSADVVTSAGGMPFRWRFASQDRAQEAERALSSACVRGSGCV